MDKTGKTHALMELDFWLEEDKSNILIHEQTELYDKDKSYVMQNIKFIVIIQANLAKNIDCKKTH